MADSEAELTLLINARNLGAKVVDQFGASVGKLGGIAEGASRRAGRAFSSLHEGITNGLGNLTETLASGGGMGDAAAAFGAYMAGQAAEQFLGMMLERLAGSAIVAAIGAPISAAMSTLGSVMAAAIPVGMSLLPVLLVAAIVAAIAFLVTHPEIVAEVARVAGSIVSGIVGGLAKLAGLILGAIVAAPGAIASVVGGFVSSIVSWFLGIPGKLLGLGGQIVMTIINGLASFPDKVAGVVRQAFAGLHIVVGPFTIDGLKGVTIALPSINANPEQFGAGGGFQGRGGGFGHHAAGGWAGLNGPELSWLGEHGPEYVRKAGTGTGDGGGGVRIVGVSERELVDMVERGLYFRLRRAAVSSTGSV